MSEDTFTEDSGLNPLGKYLIGAVAVLIIVATMYGIMHTGPSLSPDGEAAIATDENAIDVTKLRDEARSTPTTAAPIEQTTLKLLEPQQSALTGPSATPASQRTPDAMGQWRQQEALKAREAAPVVAAFEPQHNVKEIPGNAAGQSKLQPPASPWTITEGAVINAILQFGVNSDYPSDIVSQIERPLYDSATGRYLLIPAGSRLIGKFQRPTGPFQERVAIAWHRLVLPDQWSMPLPDLASDDTRGFAGVTNEVNSHYLSTFATAGVVSLLSIGSAVGSIMAFNSTQVSPYSGGLYQSSPYQQLGQLGMSNAGGQLGSTGQQFLAPRLNRPKTITIPPGFRFDVFINSDLIFPGPYADTAGQLINTVQR